MLNQPPTRPDSERGDTLVELLVALVIVSFAVVALIGGLMTSTATSSTHRNLASLDSALRAFGSSIQSAVSGQPGGASTVVPFNPCGTPYQIAGPMYPSTQAVNEPVSIPVMGLAGSTNLTATVGAQSVAAGTTSLSGAAIATFSVPGLVAGTYPVSISDGSNSVSAGSLIVGSVNSDPLAGQYTLTTQITPLGTGPCSSSNAQQLTLTLANLQPNSGAVDKTNVVLIDTRNVGVPTETVSPSQSPVSLGSTLTFTAIVPGGATGSVTWTFPNSPAGTGCAAGSNTTPLSNGSATCTIGTAVNPLTAGTYTAVAAYSGDSTHSGTSSETSAVVKPGAGNVTTSTTNSSPAQIGSTLTFTATVSSVPGITPTGSIQWSFSGAPAGAACTQGNPTTLNGGTSTCTVTPALKGTYQPTATYQPDSSSSYNSGTAGSQASVTVSLPATSTTSVTPAGTNSATTGSDIIFTATVGGIPGLTATGTVKWTFPTGTPTGAACSGGNTITLTSGTATCTVKTAATGTYTPTAAYQGDSNYGTSSGNQSTYVVARETPQVSVAAQTGTTNGKNGVEYLTFTATVQPLSGTDPVPTGSVSWMITGGATSCSSNQGLASNGKKVNTASATCTIQPSAKTSTYSAVASYSGDSNYNTASGNGSSSG